MFKSYLRNLLGRLLWRMLKIAVVLAIAFITWETVVKEKNAEKGKRLYEEGKEVYNDVKGYPSSPTYEVREDSNYIYFFAK